MQDGRYRVVEYIDSGGFGTVYKAVDGKFRDHPVAVKVNTPQLPPARSPSELARQESMLSQTRRRFEEEAVLLYRLQHPNLPRVTDYFDEPGVGLCMVMDFIEGISLAELLERRGGPLPETEALYYAREVGAALDYLHNRQPPVVHRDVKPTNIILRRHDNRVFLVDFGVAKTYLGGDPNTTIARGVTSGYSPPEQYNRNLETTPRSDIYALGATLFTLLTYSGREEDALPDAISRLTDPTTPTPTPRSRNPAVSLQTSFAVMRAISLRADARHENMAAFLAALPGADAARPPATPAAPDYTDFPGYAEFPGRARLEREQTELRPPTEPPRETAAPPPPSSPPPSILIKYADIPGYSDSPDSAPARETAAPAPEAPPPASKDDNVLNAVVVGLLALLMIALTIVSVVLVSKILQPSVTVIATAAPSPTVAPSPTPAFAPVSVERVSLAVDGAQANHHSTMPVISADGRFVAFVSDADNLVPGDTNDAPDVFVHDRQTGQISRVSVASDGMQGNGNSGSPAISADGRYVAFESHANNLIHVDINGVPDIFIHDRQTEQTSLVSVGSDGARGNRGSSAPSVSADGRYVAFSSYAANLIPGDSNSKMDIFVHDRQTGQTSLVSVASDGTKENHDSHSPSISADGRYVAFTSYASNLVRGDSNGRRDIFVHDRQTVQTSHVSVASDGTKGNRDSLSPSISADGRYVAFESRADNLVPDDWNRQADIFIHDRQTGQTTRVSIASDGTQGNDHSYFPSLSADGRYVAFYSFATNLVASDSNGSREVFVHDRQTGQTGLVSVASDDTQGNLDLSIFGTLNISADGRYVAFESGASNLVDGDSIGSRDIFIVGLQLPDDD